MIGDRDARRPPRFEHAHPRHSPRKREAIRKHVGIGEARYYQLLIRAAASADGIAADPFTARRVRTRVSQR